MKALLVLLTLICITTVSCDSLLESNLPSDQLQKKDALKNASDVQDVLNSAYDVVANYYDGEAQTMAELLGDNLKLNGTTGFLAQVYNRGTDFFNSDVGSFYAVPYTAVLRANLLIAELEGVPGVSAEDKKRILAEAHFIRGISHFELVRLFAQPFGYTSDNSHPGVTIRTVPNNDPAPRNTVKEVYDQVVADLSYAEENLPASNGNYANVYAAKAFLAKAYFQMNNYQKASDYAVSVIESGKYTFDADSVNQRYSAQGINVVPSESIFTIISKSAEDRRTDTYWDQYRTAESNVPYIRVNKAIYDLMPPTDKRKDKWFLVKNPGASDEYVALLKFNKSFMNLSVTNLTEMMLIASESLAELNKNLDKSVQYLNLIRKRAGLAPVDVASTPGFIINTVRNERRIEFIGEGIWSHDLKRRGAKGENIIIRNAPWNCPGMILQFPSVEQTSGFVMNQQGGC